jgi:hypothetical protein
MVESLWRVIIIAHNSLLEAMRQRVLLLLVLFSLVCIGSANPLTSFTFEDQLKFVKDFSFGAMSVFGLLLAVLGAAQMMQAEIENRIIYTILSKPIRRSELLWGKFLGLCSLILLAVALMTVVFVVVLHLKEASLVAEELSQTQNPQDATVQLDLQNIHRQANDPQMIQVGILVIAKLLLTAGLATLVSTVSTSMIFTVATSLSLYLIGHLQSIARETWFHGDTVPGLWQKLFAGVIAILVPDFGAFGIMDDILAGSPVHWHYTLNLVTYSAVYILIVLCISQLIFDQREF